MAIYDVSTTEKKASPSLVAGGTLYADNPLGTILPFGSANIPTGWLLCDGTAISRTTYSELFAVIGTAFGSGDGTSTFNVPDMTGKTAMGVETDHALGASENGALPNVKSNESQSLWAWNKSNSTGYNGAMGVVTLDQGYHATTEGASGRFGTFVVDASKVSNIYKDGQNKVDPANVRVNYIIKAKMIGVPADFMAKVNKAVESVYGDIIPSDASASNKLVTHQTPYESFTLNNNSGSQKWYKLGTYMSGNNTARLDFVSARVDGQMFESSVRISGIGTNTNYVSWIGEKGCEISTIDIKVDTNRNLYVKMNSYSAVEIRVYGVFTLDIVEQSSEPSGTQIAIEKLVTESDINTVTSGTATNTANVTTGTCTWVKKGSVVVVTINSFSPVTYTGGDRQLATGLPKPISYTAWGCNSVDGSVHQLFSIGTNGILMGASGSMHGGVPYYQTMMYLTND